MGTSDPAAQRNTHALEVWELEKFFVDDKGEHVKAVDGVSFNVEEGSFYTLLGPSGCGKTTTLRCVAGLERSDGGQITVGGQKVSGSGSFVPPHLAAHDRLRKRCLPTAGRQAAGANQ
jgi:ABC-type Fe3+/spermidine/putrescine transport system ATPase subunit